jgi:hypothetical protein
VSFKEERQRQVKVNEWEGWQDVVGERPKTKLPAKIGGKTLYLDKLWILDNGVRVSPENPNIEVRHKS